MSARYSFLAVVIEEPQGGDTSVRVLGVVVEVLLKKGAVAKYATAPLLLDLKRALATTLLVVLVKEFAVIFALRLAFTLASRSR